MSRRLSSLLCAGLLLPVSGVSLACSATSFDSTQLAYDGALPELRWAPVQGATGYRVDLVARVPEGAILERRTTRTTETSVDRPRLDPTRATKLTLSVATECGEQRAPVASRTLVVAPQARCAPTSDVRVERGPARTVRWTAPAGVEVEARVFDAERADLIAQPSAPDLRRVTLPGASPVVVVLRPRCGGDAGPARYLFVD